VTTRARRALHGAAIGALLVCQVASALVVAHRVDPVTVDDAIARFRSTTASPIATSGATAATVVVEAVAPSVTAAPATAEVSGADGPSAPPPRPSAGVYMYDTDGSETVDLPGGHRTYPSQTTITYMHTPCGVDARWSVFDERWELWQLCSRDDQGIEFAAITAHHEYMGQVERRTYTCRAGTDLRPTTDRTAGRCEEAETWVESVAILVGIETIEIAGVPVEAAHVRHDMTMHGTAEGTRGGDSWLRVTDGLLLRHTDTTDLTGDSVLGHVRYREDVVIELASMAPLT
jgi:hypothetical protein